MKNNLSLKIISVLFAIVMWFYIIEVQSPEIEKTIKDIPVLFTEKSALDSKNFMLVSDKDYTVDLRVRGQRKYLVDLNKSNVSVLADVGKIQTTGTHSVYTNVVLPFGNVEIVNQNPSVVTVSVEEIIEAEKDVLVKTVGTPANGYTVGEIKTTPTKIKIKGAKSIVGSIDHLLATVDVSGKSEDISSIEEVELIGSTDTVVTTSYVTLEEDKVDVHCEILKKKIVGIEPRFDDTIDWGKYSLDSNSVKTIEVAGTASIMDKLQKIETKTITQSMIENEDSVEIEIELILPRGVISLDGDKVTLKLKKNY